MNMLMQNFDRLTRMSALLPRLVICDCQLIDPVKKAVVGEKFENDIQVEELVCKWLPMRSTTFYKTGNFQFAGKSIWNLMESFLRI